MKTLKIVGGKLERAPTISSKHEHPYPEVRRSVETEFYSSNGRSSSSENGGWPEASFKNADIPWLAGGTGKSESPDMVEVE